MTSPIDKVIKHFGGIGNIRKILGVSYVAIKKWKEKGRFPRTDYTGETDYAETLANASNGAFTADELLPKYQKTEPTQTKNPLA